MTAPCRASLVSYRCVVGVRPRARRPRYGTRYLVDCSCGGFSLAGVDYVTAARRWRAHRAERNPK